MSLPSAITTTTAAPAQAATAMPGAFQVTGSLLLVIGMIFALAFVLRRVQGLRAGGQGGVKLHGGLQVGARERVLLIESLGRRLLIGVAPGSVRTLHIFDPAEVAALPETPARATSMTPTFQAAFAERLRGLLGKSGGGAV